MCVAQVPISLACFLHRFARCVLPTAHLAFFASFTDHISHSGGDDSRLFVHWPQPQRYCPHCGAKGVTGPKERQHGPPHVAIGYHRPPSCVVRVNVMNERESGGQRTFFFSYFRFSSAFFHSIPSRALPCTAFSSAFASTTEDESSRKSVHSTQTPPPAHSPRRATTTARRQKCCRSTRRTPLRSLSRRTTGDHTRPPTTRFRSSCPALHPLAVRGGRLCSMHRRS